MMDPYRSLRNQAITSLVGRTRMRCGCEMWSTGNKNSKIAVRCAHETLLNFKEMRVEFF